MLNKKEFDYLGITKFHEAGYTGKNVTVASKESILKDTFPDVENDCPHTYKSNSAIHGTNVMDYICQVVPDARKIAVDMSGTVKKNIWNCAGIEKLIADPPDVFTSSNYSASDSEENHMIKYRELLNKGCFLVSGAGNNGEDGVLSMVENDVFKAVGACHLNNVTGKLRLAPYSSIGEAVDYVSLSNLYATWDKKKHRGTSFSAPVFASMCALVQDFFYENTKKKLTIEQLAKFIKDNCADLGETGKDEEFGNGIFILPDPKNIEIQKYIGTESVEDMTKYDKIEEVPEWGKPTIQKLIDKGALKGDENGNLNLTYDLLRVLVIHDRLKLYD